MAEPEASSASANQNTHSSKLIDDILGRKKKKDKATNGTIIDTATGAPPSDTTSVNTADTEIKEKAIEAAQKHDLETSQQAAQAQTQSPKPKTETPQPQLTQSATSQPTPQAITHPTTPSSPVPAPPKIEEPAAPSKDEEPERGRGKEFQSFTTRSFERSVSPGTTADGRHARTDGDKGMGYAPPTKLGKLGAKLGLGGHH